MVIDSHVLLWWLERAPDISAQARDLLDGAERAGARFQISAVTFWELRRKEIRGLIKPKLPVVAWPGLLRRLEWLEVMTVGTEIWLHTASLDWAHRDPADRIIASTALELGVPVLTKDRRFHANDSPVAAVW